MKADSPKESLQAYTGHIQFIKNIIPVWIGSNILHPPQTYIFLRCFILNKSCMFSRHLRRLYAVKPHNLLIMQTT
jgi:hypothetical protein